MCCAHVLACRVEVACCIEIRVCVLVEAGVSIEGVPVTLLDTAGVRDAIDAAERIGVERSQAAARAADIAILVIDAQVQTLSACLRGCPVPEISKSPSLKTPALQPWSVAKP